MRFLFLPALSRNLLLTFTSLPFNSYVSLQEARSKNLTHADASSFVIRGDNTRKLDTNEKRDSVRIFSKKKYARHIQIADVEHMPEGNGTWPAYVRCLESSSEQAVKTDILVVGYGRQLAC